MRLPPARDRLCVRCGQPAQSWQHRVAAGRGGPTDQFNCVPLCGDGTRGCHGWAEANVTAARAVFLDIPGRFIRGRYEGPDALYRAQYNGEVWDDDLGWHEADSRPVALVRVLAEPAEALTCTDAPPRQREDDQPVGCANTTATIGPPPSETGRIVGRPATASSSNTPLTQAAGSFSGGAP